MVQLYHLESEGEGGGGEILAKGCSSKNRKQYSVGRSVQKKMRELKEKTEERERFYSHESSSLTSQTERA